MKSSITKFVVVVLFFIFPGPAFSESLIGTWTGVVRGHVYHDNTVNSGDATMTLVIESLDPTDGYLAGYHEWFLDDDHDGKPDHRGDVVRGARDNLIGMVGFDGRSLKLLETHDNGTFEGSLAADGTLQLIYTEVDHDEATVFKAVLTRQ